MNTIIAGTTGKGKTSLMTHLLCQYAFDRPRFLSMKKEIDKLNNGGFHLTCPDHPVFSSYPIEFKKYGRSIRKNYHFDPFKFGFDNKFVDTIPSVPYGVYGIMEAQEFFNSRMSLYFGDWVSRAFEQHRHNDLTFFMDTQRPELIDANIREISNFIIVKNLDIYCDKFTKKITRLEWIVDKIEDDDLYKLYKQSGGLNEKTFTREKIVANYNVFKLYDSKADKPKFYSSLMDKDFTLIKGEITGKTLESYKNFLSKYSNARPDGYYQKRSALV